MKRGKCGAGREGKGGEEWGKRARGGKGRRLGIARGMEQQGWVILLSFGGVCNRRAFCKGQLCPVGCLLGKRAGICIWGNEGPVLPQHGTHSSLLCAHPVDPDPRPHTTHFQLPSSTPSGLLTAPIPGLVPLSRRLTVASADRERGLAGLCPKECPPLHSH